MFPEIKLAVCCILAREECQLTLSLVNPRMVCFCLGVVSLTFTFSGISGRCFFLGGISKGQGKREGGWRRRTGMGQLLKEKVRERAR